MNGELFYYICVLGISGIFGYLARRVGWMRREQAGIFLMLAIVLFEAPLGLIAVWRLDMGRVGAAWQLPVLGFMSALIMLGLGFVLARRMNLLRPQVPSFAFSTGISNIGYTLGGFLALAYLGNNGLGAQFIYAVFWPFYIFLVIFPICHHYVSTTRLHPALLLWKSLTDLRSLPIYMVTIGIVLNLSGVAYPQKLMDSIRLRDVLLSGGMAFSYLGIGLSTVFGAMRPYLRQSMLICGLKFVATPLLMFGLVSLFGVTGLSRQVLMLLSFMPSGIYSVMASTLFGLDRDLTVTNLLVTHAVFFAIVLPFILQWGIYV